MESMFHACERQQVQCLMLASASVKPHNGDCFAA
jgi:hypothetical protein